MKQSRVNNKNKQNLKSSLERLPVTGCEYLAKTIREILKLNIEQETKQVHNAN